MGAGGFVFLLILIPPSPGLTGGCFLGCFEYVHTVDSWHCWCFETFVGFRGLAFVFILYSFHTAVLFWGPGEWGRFVYGGWVHSVMAIPGAGVFWGPGAVVLWE